MFLDVCPGDRILGETLLFAGCDSRPLLYPVERILSVYNATLDVRYEEGRDWSYDKLSRRLVRPQSSSMPALSPEEMRPATDRAIFYPAPNHNAITGGPDGCNLIFDNTDFFARHQVEVDYVAGPGTTPVALLEPKPALLQRLMDGWKNKAAWRVTAVGDSITIGFNSGKFIGFPPYRPNWVEQVCRALSPKVQVQNHAIDGASLVTFLEKPDLYLDGETDLWIIAFGMNDQTRYSPKEFADNLRRMAASILERNPQAQFIFVTSMTGNPIWSATPQERVDGLADAMRSVAAEYGDRAVLADVNKVWKVVLNRKSFYDVTGNGVNHPNDFGHILYAETILKTLGVK